MLAPRATQRVYDRRTRDLPFNAMTGTAVFPDVEPGPTGTDRIRATVSLRDDPLGRLHARRQIREDQYAAGRHWQALHEAVQIGCVRAVDTTVEPVDGGGWPDPVTERQRRAALELARLAHILGTEGHNLVYLFLAQRLFLHEIATMGPAGLAGKTSAERAINYLGMRLRECLSSLARATGYSG